MNTKYPRLAAILELFDSEKPEGMDLESFVLAAIEVQAGIAKSVRIPFDSPLDEHKQKLIKYRDTGSYLAAKFKEIQHGFEKLQNDSGKDEGRCVQEDAGVSLH